MCAFERVAMDEKDASKVMKPLDYIFSVEILNEGVDIVEVNQVIINRDFVQGDKNGRCFQDLR